MTAKNRRRRRRAAEVVEAPRRCRHSWTENTNGGLTCRHCNDVITSLELQE